MALKGIAAQVGVSVPIVSRIINSPGDSFARREVRDHVQAIIKETGYAPNQNVRTPEFGEDPSQEPSVGALTYILGRTRTIGNNPFFAQLVRAIEQRAPEQSYPMRHSYLVFDVKTSAIPEKIESFEAGGAIILGRFSGNYIGFLEQQHKDLIYVDRNVISAGCDQIICDGYEATQIVMDYLIACGHRRTSYTSKISNEVRHQAYLDTLRENELEYSWSLVDSCLQNRVGDCQGVEYLLRMASLPPAAVFYAIDVAVIATLRRFTEAKIKMPEQPSLISMDSIELSGYASPMLTTVGMPIAEMGNIAMQTLINRTQKRHKLPMKTFLPDKLAIRESVMNLNEGMYV